MTSQTYNAADDHVAPENDLMVRDDYRIAPADNQIIAPDDEVMLPDDHVMPARHDIVDEGSPELHPAGAWVTGDFGKSAAAVPEHQGFAPVVNLVPMVDVAHESGMADTDGESASTSPVLVPEAESASVSPRAIDSAGAGDRWHEIQAMFVDDPRASVELAAGLVDDRVEVFVVSVKDMQQTLQSAWQGDDAGTEDLRVALRRYRAFWNHLEDIPT